MIVAKSAAIKCIRGVDYFLGKEIFEELLEGWFEGSGVEGAVKEKEYADKIQKAISEGGWIRNFKYRDDVDGAENAFKNEDCYKDAVNSLDGTWNDYNSDTAYRNPASGFKTAEVEKVLDQQISMLDQSGTGLAAYFTNGLVLTPNQEMHTTSDTISFRDQYMFLQKEKK